MYKVLSLLKPLISHELLHETFSPQLLASSLGKCLDSFPSLISAFLLKIHQEELEFPPKTQFLFREEFIDDSTHFKNKNHWEMEKIQKNLCLLNNISVKQNEEDRLFWKEDKKGTYTIRANIAFLEGNLGGTSPWDMIWNSCVSPKVCFFA